MPDILMSPEIQSSLVPFFLALMLGLILAKGGDRWIGFAVMGGLLGTIYLTVGLNFQPLTSTRKIILCSLLIPIFILLLDLFRQRQAVQNGVLTAALGLAAVWIAWPVLARAEGMDRWLTGGRTALYAAVIGALMFWVVRGKGIREGGAMLGLSIGTGICVVTGASALYGQLSFASAAATGGVFLLVLARKFSISRFGSVGLASVAVPLALMGGAATIYAKLPPLALLFLALCPLFAAIPLSRITHPWLRATLTTLLAIVPGLPALWLTWQSAGPVMY